MTKVNKHSDILTLDTFEHLEYALCDVVNLWRRALAQKTKALGISVIERRTLIAICRHPGSTQAEIARQVDLEPQNLTRILDKFTEQGLIEKKADAKDRRANRLYTTKKAQPLMHKFFASNDELRPQVLTNLSKEEIKTLHTLLLKIKSNFDEVE